MIYLHNLIMDFTPDKKNEVDHINGDSLDNTRNNLRIISRIDNIHNTQVRKDNKTCNIRGVSFNKKSNKYTVDFHFNKKRLYFKLFDLIEEAVYLRFLCEKHFLKNYRFKDNDNEYHKYIKKLTQEQKDKIKKYFDMKI